MTSCAPPARGSRRQLLITAADARFLAGSVRSGLRWKVLLPAWAWMALAGPITFHAGGILGGLALAASGLVVWGIAASHARHEVVNGSAPRLTELARSVARSTPDIFLAPLGTLAAPGLFFSLALTGALIFLVPVVGTWLGALWLATGGLVLFLLGGYWLALGLAAIPFEVAAATSGSRQTCMEIVAESLGKVRRQPLRVALSWAVLLALAVPAMAALAAILGAVLAAAGGSFAVWSIWALPGTWLPWLDPATAAPGIPAGVLLVARIAPAYLLACLFAGSPRLDMLLDESPAGVPLAHAGLRGGDEAPPSTR